MKAFSASTVASPATRFAPVALRLAAVSALVALGGCGSPMPVYQRPAAPLPGAFADDSAAAGQRAAHDIDWQQYFVDPRLKRLIEIALANNRDLRVAVLNIEQARAQFQLRRSDELPTLAAGASATRQPGNNGSLTSSYAVGLSVTGYELDLFGRVRSLSDAALASYFGTEEARKAVQISLVAAVANAHLALLADDELLAVTRQALATREKSLSLTTLKFDNGAVSALDQRQSESLLEGARATLAQLLRQRAQDQNALLLLLGQPLTQAVAAELPPALPLVGQALLAELPAGVPSEVLARRPDVRQAEQNLIAANANIGAARAAFFPKILLTGSAGIASNDLEKLFKGGSLAWSFAPTISLPIFDAGRTRANLDVAQVGRDIAVAQYEKAVQSAFREVADALAGRATLGEQQRAQQAQAAAELQRFKLADLRYRNGASSYLDVLDAQRSLFSAQQAAVQVQAAQAQNLVNLYKVLGGGWTEPATAP